MTNVTLIVDYNQCSITGHAFQVYQSDRRRLEIKMERMKSSLTIKVGPASPGEHLIGGWCGRLMHQPHQWQEDLVGSTAVGCDRKGVNRRSILAAVGRAAAVLSGDLRGGRPAGDARPGSRGSAGQGGRTDCPECSGGAADARTGYTASGGTFGAYLGTLRRNALVEVDGGEVRASAELFAGDLSAPSAASRLAGPP
jgi:hypothetical protein